jgi:hypothetical protein
MELDMPQRAIRTDFQFSTAGKITGDAARPQTGPYADLVAAVVQLKPRIREICQRVDVACVVFPDTFDECHDRSFSFA